MARLWQIMHLCWPNVISECHDSRPLHDFMYHFHSYPHITNKLPCDMYTLQYTFAWHQQRLNVGAMGFSSIYLSLESDIHNHPTSLNSVHKVENKCINVSNKYEYVCLTCHGTLVANHAPLLTKCNLRVPCFETVTWFHVSFPQLRPYTKYITPWQANTAMHIWIAPKTV